MSITHLKTSAISGILPITNRTDWPGGHWQAGGQCDSLGSMCPALVADVTALSMSLEKLLSECHSLPEHSAKSQ